MPSLFLLTPGTQASLRGERVAINVPAQEPDEAGPKEHEIALRDIEHVVVTTSVHVSMPLIAAFLQRAIPMIVTAGGERVLGHCLAPGPHSRARLVQYEKSLDPHFALAVAAICVEAKIQNQRRVLQRLAANRAHAEVEESLKNLDELAGQCMRTETLETLRGYEGAAAGRYFETYGRYFPPHAPFERRSRRPPHNAVNAVLSYAYTILAAEMECHLHITGLDPAVGFFHETQDRRPSLALDLIEPFRAPLADALALDLFSHKTLKPLDHFELRDGGVYLNTEGKKRFFVAWERRLTREFQNPRTGIRTSLRGECRRTALSLKQALLDGGEFQAFQMN